MNCMAISTKSRSSFKYELICLQHVITLHVIPFLITLILPLRSGGWPWIRVQRLWPSPGRMHKGGVKGQFDSVVFMSIYMCVNTLKLYIVVFVCVCAMTFHLCYSLGLLDRLKVSQVDVFKGEKTVLFSLPLTVCFWVWTCLLQHERKTEFALELSTRWQ